MTKGNYCYFSCIHFRSSYESEYDSEGNCTEIERHYCDLGKSEIYNRLFCEDYEE